MLRLVLGGVLALAATGAAAEEKLLTGAPPAWVKPAPDLKFTPPPAEGQAVRVLRLDRQLHFSPDGDAIYLETIGQVRTAQGLQGSGTLSVSWDPSRDTLTVHKLRLVRADQTIDLLARQSFNVVRRETNFTQVVDGRLTATLQPEDLRIGDQIEFAYTVVHHDPVLQGRTDIPLNLDSLRGAADATLRATWPVSDNVVWRAGSGLPKPTVTRGGNEMELTLQLKDMKPLEGPKGAPRRYWPTRELEFSGFKSWAEVATTVAPLFQKASQLAPDSPLKAEVAKIRSASSDPKVQAAAALKLVQDQVRYLALLLTDGGYTPVDADKTWERRFGECKAKSVLLVALLRELGIEAEPVLVNAINGEGLDRTLPRMSAFNHVIVRATIGGKVYWLDGTRTGDGEIDRIPNHRWALPLRTQGAELIPLLQPAPDKPLQEIALDIDASSGIQAAAPVKAEMVLRGDAGQFPAMMTANVSPADREKVLKAVWTAYPWIEVKTVEGRREDGAYRIAMEGTAKLRWAAGTNGTLWFVWPNGVMGQRTVDFKRDPGPGADAPFAVAFPQYASSRLSIRLPNGGVGFSAPAPDISKTVAGRAWFRKTTVSGDRIVIETSVRALGPEFPAAEAEAAATELPAMAAQVVAIQAPRVYRPTDGDAAAVLAETPKTAQEFVVRGAKLLQGNRPKEALADFDKAVALDPKSSVAFASRGTARVALDQGEPGRQDFETARTLDPRNSLVHWGLGDLAMRQGRYAEAAASFTRAVELSPNNFSALAKRADAYRMAGDLERAMADVDTLLAMEPKSVEALTLRASVHGTGGDYPKSLAAIDEALAIAPADTRLLMLRGGLLSRMNRTAEAQAAFAAAIAAKPTSEAYLTRALNRPKTDLAGRLADIDAAEKLSPNNVNALSLRVRSYFDAGKPAGVIPTLDQALKANPRAKPALTWRGEAYARAGQKTAAARDFGDLRLISSDDAMTLNNLCWTEATLGFELEAALGDCDAALKLRPEEAAFLDSRGLVLLRLGRHKEALEAYDKAVRKRPRQAQSIYGRGLTRLKLGQTADGEADLAAARKISDRIDEEFAGYGVKP